MIPASDPLILASLLLGTKSWDKYQSVSLRWRRKSKEDPHAPSPRVEFLDTAFCLDLSAA